MSEAAPAILADRLLTPDDVSHRLAVSRSMVYALISQRKLAALYIGRLPRITERELALYLERARSS